MNICTQIDDLLDNKTIWEVKLVNLVTVYQDDNRPGIKEPCAWKRLREYVNWNNLDIIGLKLRFRDHVEIVKTGIVKGFYFSKGIGQDSNSTTADHYYVAGWIDDNDYANCLWFKVPELIVVTIDKKYVGDPIWNNNVIWNPNYGQTTNRKQQL